MIYRTQNSAWKNHWLDSVAERDFEPDNSALIDEVVSMGKSMGLKVESEDDHELLKNHERAATHAGRATKNIG